ncbi:hypothetical protein K438DRAFT_1785216 [Mycena galopus ATCC 62051]|nr:hypothetical protein K438DRAFT_1785216 [Mycena galopus ATCC 62051]
MDVVVLPAVCTDISDPLLALRLHMLYTVFRLTMFNMELWFKRIPMCAIWYMVVADMLAELGECLSKSIEPTKETNHTQMEAILRDVVRRVQEIVLRLRHSLEGEKPALRKPALREERRSFGKPRNEGSRKKAQLPPTSSWPP